MTTSWGRIALLYAIGVMASGQIGLVPPLVPLLQSELGLSLSGAGMTVSIVTLAAAGLGLIAGHACERMGHARAVHAGLLIMAAAAGLCALADGAVSLLAARAVAGFGYLLAVVAAPSLMAAVAEPRHHAVTLSLWGTFVPTGIALSEIAASNFAQGFAWRTLFGLDAVLLASILLVALVGLRPADHPPAPVQRPGIRRGLMAAMPLALAFFCFALLFLALTGMLPAYLVGQRGLSAGDAGRLVAVTTALGIPGSLAAAELMRRGVAPSRLIAIGLAASMTVAALSFAGLPLPVALAGFALSFAIGGLVPAAAFASVPRIAPDSQAIGRSTACWPRPAAWDRWPDRRYSPSRSSIWDGRRHLSCWSSWRRLARHRCWPPDRPRRASRPRPARSCRRRAPACRANRRGRGSR